MKASMLDPTKPKFERPILIGIQNQDGRPKLSALQARNFLQ